MINFICDTGKIHHTLSIVSWCLICYVCQFNIFGWPVCQFRDLCRRSRGFEVIIIFFNEALSTLLRNVMMVRTLGKHDGKDGKKLRKPLEPQLWSLVWRMHCHALPKIIWKNWFMINFQYLSVFNEIMIEEMSHHQPIKQVSHRDGDYTILYTHIPYSKRCSPSCFAGCFAACVVVPLTFWASSGCG